MEANAQDIAKTCSAEADARGLRGQENIAFQTKCMAAASGARASTRARSTNPYRDIRRAEHAEYCLHPVNNVANVLIGSCPICVLLASVVEGDGHCYGR
jgi:hypothetical protein